MPNPKLESGTITWFDLTVPDAKSISDFYRDVVGWVPEPVDMGAYSDFNMNTPESGTCAAGICHARGTNAGFPAQWLIYITVADLDASLAQVEKHGGKIVVAPKNMGAARYCVIQDPAGAVAALFQPGA